MDNVVIYLAAFIGSLLTYFSGYGLSMLLLPVFGLFFPIDLAILMTALVHFLNNLFRLMFSGRNVNVIVMMRFGLPAMFAAVVGAFVLIQLSHLPPLLIYEWMDTTYSITPVNIVVAVLLFVFTAAGFIPFFKSITFSPESLPFGGLLSGFFVGLCGLQGGLRSVFLVKLHLGKEQFVSTGLAIASVIDLARLTVYFLHVESMQIELDFEVLLISVLSAFSAAYVGKQFLEHMTLRTIQIFVAILLMVFSVLLGLGII